MPTTAFLSPSMPMAGLKHELGALNPLIIMINNYGVGYN